MTYKLSLLALALATLSGCNSSNSETTPPDEGVTPTPDKPIPAFNLTSIAKATGNALTFEWDGENQGITYEVCQKDAAQPYNCLVKATVESQSSATVNITNTLETHAADFFIRASRGTESNTSNENTPDIASINDLVQYLKADVTSSGDRFGADIALSKDGTVLIVGAPWEASASGDPTDDSSYDVGVVYVFRLNTDTNEWHQEAYVKPDFFKEEMYFSEDSLAISDDGNTFVVGSYGESSDSKGINQDHTPTGASYSGAGYIFKFDGDKWVQDAYVKASNTSQNDYFGWASAISGDGKTVVFGASGESSNAKGINQDQENELARDSGAAYVFDLNETTQEWEQTAYIKSDDTGEQDYFGGIIEISADGTTLAIGANGEDGAADATNDSGGAYIFQRTDRSSQWTQKAHITAHTPTAGQRFPSDIAMSDNGELIAFGSAGDKSNATGVDGDKDDTSLTNAGAVFTYRYNNSTTNWEYKSYIKASNTSDGAMFGHRLDIDSEGKRMVIGSLDESYTGVGVDAPQLDKGNSETEQGSVYVFEFNDELSQWAQKTYLKAKSPSQSENFGYSVAISGDSSKIAVGMALENSSATGINGDHTAGGLNKSGAVEIF